MTDDERKYLDAVVNAFRVHPSLVAGGPSGIALVAAQSGYDYVSCFFIGGPWNNELVTIAAHIVRQNHSFRVPIPRDPIYAIGDAMAGISPLDVVMETVEYYPQNPLETGVPVYSCLYRYAMRGYWRCGLRSIHFPSVPDRWG